LKNKIEKVRDLLINDAISAEDYAEIKKQLEEKIYFLQKNLTRFNKNQENIKNLIEKLSNTLVDIDKAYFEADIDIKRQIIAAIFPEKLEYNNGTYRTPRLNEGVGLIYVINSELRKIKKRDKSVKN